MKVPATMLPVETLAGHGGFRRLATLRGVSHELRYAGTNNFAGRVLYAGFDCAWLRGEAADGLERAGAWLVSHRPGWRLEVLDALRPQRVQEAIWADVSGTPDAAYFADPALGSMHSFGMAVDVTMIGPDGREADMGSGYDEMSTLSHPSLNAEHLAAGRLSASQVAERERLAEAMARGGFAGLDNEWWHFDFGDRATVRATLPRVW